MVDRTIPTHGRPIREACSQCGGLVALLVAGAAAWAGVFLVCSRF